MAITSYTELKGAVANWLNRSDLTTYIPDFITLAEAEFNRTLRTRQMIKRSRAEFDDAFITLPSDFKEMESLRLVDGDRLEYLTPNAMLEHVEDHTTAGTPEVYTIVGGKIQVSPEPADTYEVEMVYYAAIPVLSGTNASNWLLEAHPDLYLYGTLVHSAPFLHDDERIQVWLGAHDRVTASILREEDHATLSGTQALRAVARGLGV